MLTIDDFITEKAKKVSDKFDFDDLEVTNPSKNTDKLISRRSNLRKTDEGVLDKLRGFKKDDLIKKLTKLTDNQLKSYANMASEKSARRILSPKDYIAWEYARSRLSESVELDEILNVAQRRKRGLIMKRNKNKLKMGRRRQSHRIADKDRLNTRSRRQARTAMVKKLTKGVSKGSLSPARRAEVERRLSKMSNRLDRITKRLLPSVRKAEMTRKR